MTINNRTNYILLKNGYMLKDIVLNGMSLDSGIRYAVIEGPRGGCYKLDTRSLALLTLNFGIMYNTSCTGIIAIRGMETVNCTVFDCLQGMKYKKINFSDLEEMMN